MEKPGTDMGMENQEIAQAHHSYGHRGIACALFVREALIKYQSFPR
jgi:hypothetical protein